MVAKNCADIAITDRADFAVCLGHDEVEVQGGEEVRIDGVERFTGRYECANFGVDGSAGRQSVDPCPGNSRFGGAGGGKVAFVTDGHHVVAQAERVEDLRRTGE